MATITSKGQITIPKDVRDALGLTPGSEVEISVEAGRAILRKRLSPEVLQRWRGRLRDKLPANSVDEFIDELRGERLADETQSE
jgi:antitoxin PrlF